MLACLSQNIKIYNNALLSYLKSEINFIENYLPVIGAFYITHTSLLYLMNYLYGLYNNQFFTIPLVIHTLTFMISIILMFWKKIYIFSEKAKYITIYAILFWLFIFVNNYMLFVDNFNVVYQLSFIINSVILLIFFNPLIIIGLLVFVGFSLKSCLITNELYLIRYSVLIVYIVFLATVVKYIKIIIQKTQYALIIEKNRHLEEKYMRQTSYILHDVINPLHGVMGITNNLIEANGKLNKAIYIKQIQNIDSALSVLSNFISTTMLNNKIKLQEGVIAWQTIDLITFVNKIIQDIKKLYPQVVITLHTEINELKITVDKIQIYQLITNIISNAIKYGNNSDILVKIDNFLQNNKSYGKVQIIDGGEGICDKKINSIFEPYNRAGARENIYGIGLGLALCKEIVEAHNGLIWAENNTISKGAIFNVLLPTNNI